MKSYANKQLILLLLSFLAFSSYSQKPIALLAQPEYNILYRGYPNIVCPMVSNCGNTQVILSADSYTQIEKDTSGCYIVYPGKDHSSHLYVIMDSLGSYDTISTYTYRIMRLPDPDLFWGAVANGGTASLAEERLFVRSSGHLWLHVPWEIESWKITIRKKYVSGTGNNISAARPFFRRIRKHSPVTVEAIVIGPDGSRRTISGSWMFNPPGHRKINDDNVFVEGCG